ncbi:MAG: Gfo/Idh/MocA family protein [Pseudomonadales bacterium]
MSDSSSIVKPVVRMGMVGGGEGAFIGPVHRMAAELDGRVRLTCGAFAAEAERSIRSGQRLYGLPRERCYPSYQEMLVAEQALPVAQRMQFVTIVTPNHLHFDIARAALEAGFAVVCDKPLGVSVAQAQSLVAAATAAKLPLLVTYNYTGYPMIREARARLASGQLGPVRRVIVEYLQGWLAQPVDNKQANWRTDPAQAGPVGCLGDIGSHAHSLAEFVLGEPVTEVSAHLQRFVPGRALDDDAQLQLRFASGASGTLLASQVAFGEENNLRLRVYAESGALSWSQQAPNSLYLIGQDSARVELRTGGPEVSQEAAAVTRLPAGHPEGYLESFATLYREFAESFTEGSLAPGLPGALPDVYTGLAGMQFIEAAVRSDQQQGHWERLA